MVLFLEMANKTRRQRAEEKAAKERLEKAKEELDNVPPPAYSTDALIERQLSESRAQDEAKSTRKSADDDEQEDSDEDELGLSALKVQSSSPLKRLSAASSSVGKKDRDSVEPKLKRDRAADILDCFAKFDQIPVVDKSTLLEGAYLVCRSYCTVCDYNDFYDSSISMKRLF